MLTQSTITAAEVAQALGCLNNGHAPGPDISKELMKYAPSVIFTPLANITNMMFEQHTELHSLGRGTLIALQKPRKPPGPLSILRPLCFQTAPEKSSLLCFTAYKRN